MKENENLVTFSFKVPQSIMEDFRKKIARQNAKANARSERTSVSGKVRELVINYISA